MPGGSVSRNAAPRRGVSIRLRLTLLYTAILAVTLLAFGVALYLAQSQATYGGIRVNLVRQAEEYVRRQAFPNGDRDRPPPPDAVQPEGALPGRWTQVRTLSGEVTGQTGDLSGTTLPLSDAGLAAVQDGRDHFETASVEAQPVMIYSLPFRDVQGESRIVQVAFPIGQSQQSLAALRLILIAGSAVAILVAFLLGWLLAGAGLDPIHRITQTARAIGQERDVTRRVPYAGATDEVGRLAVTFNDMLGELESAYRQLEGSLASQKRFVADASHELRTPLTTVRGNIELLGRRPSLPPAEQAEVLADTTEEVDRLIRLVNQLLVLARADAGQQIALEPLPLQPLLEDVCRQAKTLDPGRSVCCEATPATITGNRDALKQVLLILVDNASRHTPASTAIELRVEVRSGEAAIHVTDHGPGIEPAALPHIFERFYRGEASRSGKGAGLGLAIAQELVQLQRGSLTVTSEPDRGTTFSITLPLATE